MDKRIAIELIKVFEDIMFTEHLEGEDVIGFIQDHQRQIQVSFLGDNNGYYLKLCYTINDIDATEEMLFNIDSRLVNGRSEIKENGINLYTIIPILDESFLKEQLIHGLREIWDMSTIVNHFQS